MPALAITDHGNLYGAIAFYKKCKKAGIKPIIGVEAYIAERTRFDKEPNIDNRRYHLTLLAKNLTGYHNLIQLVSKANLEGYYYKPRMDHDLLAEHHEGIICLSGCFGSELSRALRSKNKEKAIAIAKKYQNIFGYKNYYLEIMHHPSIEDHEMVRNEIIALSKKLNIPLVGTQDSHYADLDDKLAHETLLAVQTGADTGKSKFTFGAEDFSFIDTETAKKYFKNTPEAVENTERIAEQCNLEISLGEWVFPDFEIPKASTHDKELKKLAYEGIASRGLTLTKEIENRIEHELKIIGSKGYAPYFLVVADILRFSHQNDIFTNTRGSAAGSMVSYLAGITSVNPIEFQLPFERFLNPERPSPPDIDMDFADNRRDEVIDYARKKYGNDKVAQIGTFGTMMARGAVRDVARALGYSYDTGDKISRLIPFGSQGFPMTLNHAKEITPELKEMYEKDKDTKKIIDLAKKLEGCVRHVSVHAAGVVIAPSDVTDFVPLQHDPKGGKIITQYDMYAVEDAGLLKFDFLGIRNLSILGDSVRLVKKYHKKDVDIENIPLDDKKTFEKLARGETMGLFQLNGSGMTRYLIEMKPTKVEDLNIMVALYRPGPMSNIDEYIERKHGRKPIEFFHPKMKEFLEPTYGVLVYQDDLLMTAIEVAGYSWGEVDKFRKAVGKKIPEEMARQHKIFVDGCKSHGKMKHAEAEALWKLFEPFQGYGFNKAHAASYGHLAYQTAYMKANYPTEYMSAVLTADSGDVLKIAEIVTECTRMKIPVLPPDINESFGDFTILKNTEGDKIRFGLHSIKNLGEEIGNVIIEERETNGKFTSYENFLLRVHHRNLNKKSLEALIKCGALDYFGERGQLYENVDGALVYNKNTKEGGCDQASLFELMDDQTSLPSLRFKDTTPVEQDIKLAWEKELLGLYVSGHPLEAHRERLNDLCTPIKKIKERQEGIPVLLGGIIEESKEILTKKGDRMAFVRISDFTESIETVVFPRVLHKYKDLIVIDKKVLFRGKMSHRNGTPSVIVEKVREL